MTPIQAQVAAGDPRRPRPDRAGADRQRQDRRVRARPAAPARPRADPHPGAGAVPDPRTRRPGRQAAAQARHSRIPNLKVSVLCGGIPLGPQLASLAHAPHVVVGTPGRVQELMRKNALHLRGVRTLVLDEADRMLDMGFEEPIREIVGKHAEGSPDPAVLGHLPRRDPHAGQCDAARCAGSQHRWRRRAGHDRRSASSKSNPRASAPLLAALLLQYRPESRRGVLQHAPRHRGSGRLAGALRLLRAGAARRHGAARPRRSAGAFRQPQLQRAGGQRRRRARARRRGHRRGGQLRTAHRCRHLPAPHRPHRPRRPRRPGAEPVHAARRCRVRPRSRNSQGRPLRWERVAAAGGQGARRPRTPR